MFDSLAGASGIVLAVSGGPDSTALMHLAATWRPAGMPMRVATVDHGLRPEAAGEAQGVVAAASRLDLPGAVLRWDGAKPDRRLQERARAARYDLLLGFARDVGASHLVTAHTLDDQAETLLMRLAAGSGPTGLAGMRALSRRGGLVLARPLLGLRKSALVALCRERDWPFFEDPANGDTRFARARWRQLAPVLAAEGLTAERLGHLAARLARAEAALDHSVASVVRACARDANRASRRFAAQLLDQPDELVLRILQSALRSAAPQAAPRLNRLEHLLAAIRQARSENRRLRRSLQGCTVTLDPGGGLTICVEPPRRSSQPRGSNVSPSLNAKP